MNALRYRAHLKVHIQKLLTDRSSLRARVFIAGALIVMVVMLYFFYTLYTQQQLARITREILDKRIVQAQAADKIKHTVFKDEIALFHYLATRDTRQLIKGDQLGQAALDEIANLRQLSPNPVVQARLTLIEAEIRRYFSDARTVIAFSQSHTLPPHAEDSESAAWASHRPREHRELEVLSEESEQRLAHINSLCDELIAMNQREMENARLQMREILKLGRRDALLAGVMVCLVVLWVVVRYSLSLLRPLRALLRGVHRVQKGDLDFQVPILRSDEVGQLTGSFNRMTRTINEQRRLLMQENITDGLTGLYNHRHFRALLKQEIERAQRMDVEFSLLMLDIDHFKQYNDTLGHEFGNELLISVSSTIRDSLRDIDILARYGGDELSAILPGTSAEEARKLAHRIDQAIADQRFFCVDEALPTERLTISIGGASYPKDALTINDLIRQADEALYAAKRAGRACIRWAGLMHQEAV